MQEAHQFGSVITDIAPKFPRESLCENEAVHKQDGDGILGSPLAIKQHFSWVGLGTSTVLAQSGQLGPTLLSGIDWNQL